MTNISLHHSLIVLFPLISRAETVLQKKGGKVIGASIPPIHVRLQYTSLTPVTIDTPLPTPLTEHQEGIQTQGHPIAKKN